MKKIKALAQEQNSPDRGARVDRKLLTIENDGTRRFGHYLGAFMNLLHVLGAVNMTTPPWMRDCRMQQAE